nr:tripartite tricarboxylate transporter TctB family protein [Pseudoxanthomonas sp.]
MKLKIRNQPDFFSGLFFIVLGVAFSWMATGYSLGTAAKMGPAYFPLLLGGLLAVLGCVIAAQSVTKHADEKKIEPMVLRPFVLVLGSVALFGALLVPLGLILASLVLVVASAIASHEFGWKYTILSVIVLTGACYLIFIYGLQLPLPVWPGVR